MKHNKKRSSWIVPVIIILLLIVFIGVYKKKAGQTDADLVLTISEQGFEGHLYDAGEKEKIVITFSGSEGGSAASDTMASYYKQSGISALGITLFAGKDTGANLDKVVLLNDKFQLKETTD